MNPLLKNTIAVQGLDKVMKVAQALIEADYQVMIQLEDCDVYIVSYNPNDLDLGDEIFISLPQEKVEEILDEEEDVECCQYPQEESKDYCEEKSGDRWAEEPEDNDKNCDEGAHLSSISDSEIKQTLENLHPDDIKLDCKCKFKVKDDDISRVEK